MSEIERPGELVDFNATMQAIAAQLPRSSPSRNLPKPIADGKWAVYKLYDADDVLLYVGYSQSVAHRLSQHEKNKEWWARVARISISRYETALDARGIEKHTIALLCPLFNKHFNYGRKLDPDRVPVKRYGTGVSS